MEANSILFLLIGITVFDQLLDWGLTWLNFSAHQREVPPALAGKLDPEKYAKSRVYHGVNVRFGLVQSVIGFVLIIPILAWGGLGWLDELLRGITEHPIALALLFFGVLYLFGDWMSLPFAWYRTFVIEAQFGFNHTTQRTFWMDKAKGYALTIVFGALIMSILLWLIQLLGESFWWWFWLFLGVVMLLMNLFYTSWILPLFNRLTPLESGSLRTAIEAYAAKVNFPLSHVMVIDGSKRSAKANAFFAGMGKRKKVVLYDTLIAQHSEEELVAVLAHEIGHYKKRHIYQGLVLSLLQTGLMLFILSKFLFSPALSLALGGSEWSIHLNMIGFGILYGPISTVIGVSLNALSRKNEFEADRYAAETFASQPLQRALLQLHAENLSNATPHPWYVFMNYSHPPLLQRLQALAHFASLERPATNGQALSGAIPE